MDLKKEIIEFLEVNNWLSLEDRKNAEGVVQAYLKEYKPKQLNIGVVSKSVTAKDLKCPNCKQHALMKYIDGKECTSCGYVC